VDLEENKALVRRYYHEVLTGRDRDLLARLLDSSFVSHVSGGRPPEPGPIRQRSPRRTPPSPTWW
jgi:hypothetical protein